MVDIPEMIIWTCLNWRILELPQLEQLAKNMARSANATGYMSCEGYVERLVQRGLIVSGIGGDALYDLLSDLYVIPVTSGIFVKIMAFLKFIFINGVPFRKAKEVFRNESLSTAEKRVIDLARQSQLSTAEVMKCVETDV